ncbi:MAG TPA: signal peptidase I [Hellea balneolensis]|uniref:Signal peptidase I n=1 Tax=Hellea balneolensis TaxID=287478 RepID=A0A7C5M3Y2_9PROT|nr:signal peptidase I [Hellea balneolensis]
MSDKAINSAQSPENPDEKKSMRAIIVEELKFLAGLAVFLLLFFNFVFGHYKIPSESMQPTLEVGDHLYVNKFSYGFSKHSLILGMHKLPFLKDGRVFARKPKRGDVVVFRSPARGHLIMIKRLVGLPGDKIQVSSGRLYINDKLVERKEVENLTYREFRSKLAQTVTKYQEQLPGEKRQHYIYERNDFERYDNAGPFIIPANKYFFMGDNRDNSEDSRAPHGPGFVPFDHFIGKAQMMVFSLHRCKKEEGLTCPGFRAFKKL